MPTTRSHLHLVPSALPVRTDGPAGDLGLLAFLLAVGLVPVVGSLAGGRWGEGTVGVGTVASILCLREILGEVRAHTRARR